MEPMNSVFPKPGYLEEIRQLTSAQGIVLVFDETITGFRFSKGGAQELFGITPDLSTFGKGIANGMPLSAIVGKREIMMEMKEIFFSGTFGGELLSLAAADYVLSQLTESDPIERISRIGIEISNGLNEIIFDTKMNEVLAISGHSSWTFLNWTSAYNYSVDQMKTYFLQEMFSENVLILNSHNINASMTNKDILKLLSVYRKTLSKMHTLLESEDLHNQLRVQPLPPLFRLR
jgi:glutamate-1-semialdehyde 2,1-aminomutase